MPLSKKTITSVLIIILAVSLIIRLSGVNFGYPWLKQYDEDGEIVPCAFDILDFHNSHGIAPITHNGPLLKYLMALVLGIWGVTGAVFTSMQEMIEIWRSSTLPYIVGRVIIGVLPGTLAVYVVYLIGVALKDRMTGLFSAFFMCFAFKAVEFSHYATSDITAMLLIAVTLLFSLKYLDSNNARDLRLAGIFWAAAVATKLSAAPALIMPAMAYLLNIKMLKDKWLKHFFDLLIFSAGSLAVFHLPYVLHPLDFVRLVLSTLLIDINLFEKGFFWYFRNDIYPTTELPTAGIGLTLLLISFAGLIVSLISPGRKKWVILSYAVVFYLIVGAADVKHTRYFLPMLPILVVWSGIFFGRTLQYASNLRNSKIWGMLICGVVMIAALPNAINSVKYSLQAADGNTALAFNQRMSEIVTEGDVWFKLGGAPVDYSMPGKEVTLNIFSIAKSSLTEKAREKYQAKGMKIEGLVEKEALQDSIALKTVSQNFDAQAFVEAHHISYAVIDEYIESFLTEVPDDYIKEKQRRDDALRLMEYVKSKFDLIEEFAPRYNLNWGESVAGRQPVIHLYRIKPGQQ